MIQNSTQCYTTIHNFAKSNKLFKFIHNFYTTRHNSTTLHKTLQNKYTTIQNSRQPYKTLQHSTQLYTNTTTIINKVLQKLYKLYRITNMYNYTNFTTLYKTIQNITKTKTSQIFTQFKIILQNPQNLYTTLQNLLF
jgi:hypothetical protein